jgi:excisionase family DNA binding protein
VHYSITEVAREFHVTNRTIKNWIKDGLVCTIHVGGTVRISDDEIEKMKQGGAAYGRQTVGRSNKI